MNCCNIRDFFINIVSSLYGIIPTIWALIVSLTSGNCDFVLKYLSNKTYPLYFENKVIWITGCTSGVGKFILLELAHFSQKNSINIYLILSARDRNNLENLKQLLITEYEIKKENISILPLDISKIDLIDQYIETANLWKGYVSILFNNAGIGQRNVLDGFESDLSVLNVNLLGAAKLGKQLISKCFIPKGYGHIVNTNSIQCYIALPGRSAYGASKRGLSAYYSSIRHEIQGMNWNEYYETYQTKLESNTKLIPEIYITDVFPGYISTNFDENALYCTGKTADLKLEKKKGLDPNICAKLILKAVTNKLEEVWIAKNPELLFTYISYYSPSFSKLILKYMSKKLLKPTWDMQKQIIEKKL